MKKAAEKSVTEVRIVEAAVQLFSRQGYKGTSTREIAHLAGVNEATLFRYFARKADLFWAAAESRLNRLKLGRELQHGLATDMDPEVVLPMLVDFLVKEISEDTELMRLLYVAGFELPGAERIFREHLGPIFDAVNAYFSRCATRGVICDLEPTFATLGLAGAKVGSSHRMTPRVAQRLKICVDGIAVGPNRRFEPGNAQPHRPANSPTSMVNYSTISVANPWYSEPGVY